MTENKTLSNLSSVFDSATRIQIMASLTVSPLTYAQLKKICQVTDGKLFRHIDKLIEEGFIEFEKERNDDIKYKRHTIYQLTETGRDTFQQFMKLLMESMI
ncbi:MAG: transcriptional regulator [Longibaculum muris]|uniref:Winged helix DNA-binding protein n=1 Tax=Longibaculum muris TaxID=1796628 RepID=A0A4R3Z2Z6_9FIRM|nr:transcriptional regulator [Longibaculum muris]KXU47631.1 transcriptional regulator, MarR family [Candidatus Stoquefichus sp. KLE1796]MBS5370228.1 transcriptional regulator [Coprobacillus cateniformis]MCR1888483.1 transcriptional regulator [Longibaculum muris]MED9811681.1 transcriptional regulator [Longibaculum muris]TCV98668.1 winged helix DNA-binding protein [Longibaculum muris]